jgi:hypothetical protein
MRLLAALALLRAAAAAVNVATFASTAFAGARADSTQPTVDLAAPAFSSVRVTGTVAAPQPQLVLFSVALGGGAAPPSRNASVLLYIDDHLVLDLAGRGSATAYINFSFAAAAAPAPLRLEFVNAAAEPATLSLLWQGNYTTLAPVPAGALTDAVAPAELARAALRERMAAPAFGWGTFHAPSMTTHVLLPSGFAIEATIGDAASGEALGNIIVFRQANPAIVRVGGHGYDGSNFTSLSVGMWRGRECTTLLQTTIGAGGGLQLLATTNGTACDGLVLLVSFTFLWGRAGAVTVVAPGHVRASAPGFAVDTDVFAASPSVPFPNSSDAFFALPLVSGGETGLSTGAPVAVADMAANIAAAGAAHAARRARFPGDLSDAYDAQQSIIAFNTIYTPYEGVVTPVSRGWARGGTDYVLFDWDNILLSWMASLEEDSKDICYSNLVQIVLARTMFGFVPNYHAGTHDTTDRSEPQIGAIFTLEIYRRWGDAWLVERLFDALLGWQEWIWTHRLVLSSGGPLVVLGSNNNAPRDEGNINTLAAAALESGIDNGAAFDGLDPELDFDKATGLMAQFDVGASALFVSECEALAALAPVAGRGDVVALLEQRGAAVAAAMEAVMWNADEGVYENTFARNATWHKRRMPTAFYPLISGAPTPERAAAMLPLLTSPLGFCVNATAFGDGNDANSTFLLQFFSNAQGAATHALCASDACVADALDARYTWVRVESLARVASAPGPGASTTPLRLWRNGATGRFATTAAEAPPAPGYALVRVEGHCFAAPAAGLVPLSLWRRASDGDFVTCGGNPACAVDAARGGFALQQAAMCYAYNGTTVEQLPCKFGVNSVARADPAFFDNNYWRGRIWGPQVALVWLGLRRYDALPAARAARAVLVAQALRLELQEWRLFRQVTENMNGVFGAGEDVANADPAYTWGALLGHVALLDAGF